MTSLIRRTRRRLWFARCRASLVASGLAVFVVSVLGELTQYAPLRIGGPASIVIAVTSFGWVLYRNPPWAALASAIHPKSDKDGVWRAALSVADGHPHASVLAGKCEFRLLLFRPCRGIELFHYAAFLAVMAYGWQLSEPIEVGQGLGLAGQSEPSSSAEGQVADPSSSGDLPATRQYEQVPQDAAELPTLLSGRNFGNEHAAVERFVQRRLERKASAE